MNTRGLYTPEILAGAMGLSEFPWDETLPLRGSARSRSCGSAIELGLSIDAAGSIDRLALRPHACAVGQAAANIFARSARGRTRADIALARDSLARWLAGEGSEPDWPGVGLLAPALGYPARHAAILLAWDAALEALPAQVSA